MIAITISGKMLAFSRLQLATDDEAELANFLGQLAPTKLTPVLVDSLVMQDLSALIARLWQHNIAVIGVVQGVLDEQANSLRLAIFPNDGKRIARLEPQATPTVQATTQANAEPMQMEEQTTHAEDLVCHQLVRSGQVIHHLGGDVILTKGVNNGAEVASDYSLHIYGRAEGRLVAGATGDATARIFCQVFEPSLVSVAGVYCPKDDIPSEVLGKAVMVSVATAEDNVSKLDFVVL